MAQALIIIYSAQSRSSSSSDSSGNLSLDTTDDWYYKPGFLWRRQLVSIIPHSRPIPPCIIYIIRAPCCRCSSLPACPAQVAVRPPPLLGDWYYRRNYNSTRRWALMDRHGQWRRMQPSSGHPPATSTTGLTTEPGRAPVCAGGRRTDSGRALHCAALRCVGRCTLPL